MTPAGCHSPPQADERTITSHRVHSSSEHTVAASREVPLGKWPPLQAEIHSGRLVVTHILGGVHARTVANIVSPPRQRRERRSEMRPISFHLYANGVSAPWLWPISFSLHANGVSAPWPVPALPFSSSRCRSPDDTGITCRMPSPMNAVPIHPPPPEHAVPIQMNTGAE